MPEEDDVVKAITKPIIHDTSIKFVILISFVMLNIILTALLVINMYGIEIRPPILIKPFQYDDYGYVAGTGSMLPLIDKDSVVYYINNFSLSVNDVYVYEQPGTGNRILHRLVYVDGDQCFFRGDNNVYMDPKVNCSYVKQKVKAIAYD